MAKRKERERRDLYGLHPQMKQSPQVCLQKEEGISAISAPTTWQTLSVYYFIHFSNLVE